MPDVAGFRAKIATIVPSTNTIVEADFSHLFRIPGVTFHTGRMYIERPALDSNDAFAELLEQVDHAFDTALRDVMTCEPDYLVMGMSAPTFWGGRGRQRGVPRARPAPFRSRCHDRGGGLQHRPRYLGCPAHRRSHPVPADHARADRPLLRGIGLSGFPLCRPRVSECDGHRGGDPGYAPQGAARSGQPRTWTPSCRWEPTSRW